MLKTEKWSLGYIFQVSIVGLLFSVVSPLFADDRWAPPQQYLKESTNIVRVKIARVNRDGQRRWPSSIAPNDTIGVQITISGTLSPGSNIQFDVVGESNANGTASIVQNSTRTNSGVILIRGDSQTAGGDGWIPYDLKEITAPNREKLKIRARYGNRIVGYSPGFSVCAHPIFVKKAKLADIYEDDRVGVMTEVDWSSDGGGTLADDLDYAGIQELVGPWSVQNPPFTEQGPTATARGWYYANNSTGFTDRHSYTRKSITIGTPGRIRASQLFLFACDRCGVHHVPVLFSGFGITHEVKNEGILFAAWNHYTYVSGGRVSVDLQTSREGNAAVESDDHRLP